MNVKVIAPNHLQFVDEPDPPDPAGNANLGVVVASTNGMVNQSNFMEEDGSHSEDEVVMVEETQNVRGAASKRCHRHIHQLILRSHPTILFIIETHTSFAKTSPFWRREGYEAVAIEEAHGHSGGIWALVKANYGVQVQKRMICTRDASGGPILTPHMPKLTDDHIQTLTSPVSMEEVF
ncbi:Endonuclease/exonuclease/phosphatase superfamily [Sesbania bispinosa]|nr:Endonuclease/exonuclease/phosphatase superfamily [Sesbania bispinosa]